MSDRNIPPGRECLPLLVVTGLWPTNDLPSCGVFVQRRLEGVAATVIAPRSYRGSTLLRYVTLGWRAMTARGRFRAVEAHVLFPTGLIGLLAARLRRIPLVVVAHGHDVRTTVDRNAASRLLGRVVARSAYVVVANSQDTAAYVRRLGVEPTIVTPGVDLSAFSPLPKPSKRRVLYLGGDVFSKGIDVAREFADTIVGPGIREVLPHDVPALMAEHDVVLVPSRAEGFGVVAAEAIAAGRWVVASRVGGLSDVVTDGVNGTLVDDGDFADALRRVPDYDPASVARTAEPFSLELQHQKMEQLYP